MPFPPAALRPNARVDRWRRIRAVREYRRACKVLGLQARSTARAPFPLPGRVLASVTFVVATNHKRDEDNLLASLKPAWDGLVDAGVLAGDDAGRLHLESCAIEKGREAAVRMVLRAEAGA